MNWTATIEKHNGDGLTMDVRYEREGYPPVTVGVMLPPAGADLQEHLARFAPLAAWSWEDEMRVPREHPTVGLVVSAPQAQAVAPEPAKPAPTIVLEPVR